nr:hypothetical protein GCM10020185_75480 [Pseudomonas brassicacearum subsp. brassicacearum]
MLDGNLAAQLNDSNLIFSTASDAARSGFDAAKGQVELYAPEHVELTLIGSVNSPSYDLT